MPVPEVLSPEQLRKEVEGKWWVFPYNELLATYDRRAGVIEFVEDYAPPNGLFAEAWRTTHFPKTSPIVLSGRREGTKSVFRIRPGSAEVRLRPAVAPIGIEAAEVSEDEIAITFCGLGGGGVSASYCRGLAKGVLRIEIYERGGGSKLGRARVVLPRKEKVIVSVDDTDTPDEGATYALVHNIATELNGESSRYYTHVNAQLYPGTPHKTRNCFATAVSFVADRGSKPRITDIFRRRLAQYTLSQNTAMAVFEGVVIPKEVVDYATRAKTSIIPGAEEVFKIAKANSIDMYEITGPRGVIGALAGLGMHDDPEYAASLPPDFA